MAELQERRAGNMIRAPRLNGIHRRRGARRRNRRWKTWTKTFRSKPGQFIVIFKKPFRRGMAFFVNRFSARQRLALRARWGGRARGWRLNGLCVYLRQLVSSFGFALA